jgi:serine/threonine protein phosphatase PrpC
MEDAFVADSLGNEAVFGVFDGHYGKRAAIYSAENLSRVMREQMSKQTESISERLKSGFLGLDKQVLDKSRDENWHDGTTALVALLMMEDAGKIKEEVSVNTKAKQGAGKNNTSVGKTKWGRRVSDSSLSSSTGEDIVDEPVLSKDGSQGLSVYIANAGDCRAISMYGDGRVFQLSTDHTPLLPYERWRIYRAGGNVKFGRIDAKLSVSRGFGDRQFKEPKALVSAMPEVVSFPVTHNLRFVLLACDGVWGWLDNIQVSKFISKSLRDGNRPETVCKDLVKFAFDKGSTDNISVVLLYFTFPGADFLPVPLTPTQEPNKNGPKSSKKNTTSPEDSSRKSTTFSDPPSSSNVPIAPIASSSSNEIVSSPPSKSKTMELLRSPPSRSTTGLSSSAKAKKYNFSAVANATKWPTDADLNLVRNLRGTLVTTHMATGESSYLDQSEFDSTTSDIEALTLESRLSETDLRSFSKPSSTRLDRDLDSSNSSNLDSSPLPVARSSSRPIETGKTQGSNSLKKAGRRTEISEAVSPPRRVPTDITSPNTAPATRRARMALPDDDDDFHMPNSVPNNLTKARSAPTHRKSSSDGTSALSAAVTKREVNYGLSDSEGSEEIEEEMRRRSFDQVRTVARSTPAQSSKSRQQGKSESGEAPSRAKGQPSTAKPSSKKPSAGDSSAQDVESGQQKQPLPSQPSPAKATKKKTIPLDEEYEADSPSQRRAASFDLPRTEKTKKKKSKS